MTHSSLKLLFAERFGRLPEIISRAPGRVEVIGNHTDYNGGAVVGAAIDRYVWVGAARSKNAQMRFVSDKDGSLVEVSSDRLFESFMGSENWINYPIGVWRSLEDFALPRPSSFDLMVMSDLPVGAGLSSSAALELATALALLGLVGHRDIDPVTLAKLGQHAENNYARVPCGILDQGTCALAAKDQFVHIDCRGPIFTRVPVPDQARLWVFNTMEKHALVDGLYAQRHQECASAARETGFRWLTDIPIAALPEITRTLSPALRRRVEHIVGEHTRVEAMRTALQEGNLIAAGLCMTASHLSSQRLFENSTPALDSLVQILSTQPRVFGARLTGGGFGGAVLALTDTAFSVGDADAVARVHRISGHQAPEILALKCACGAKIVWESEMAKDR